MFKLEKSLKEWVLQGFINEMEANQILHYESNKPQSSYAIISLIILGIIIVGIGVISVIAANWDRIPPDIKLLNNFLLLIICGISILFAYQRQKELLFESFILLFMILCLASIGLISQVFHLSGEIYEALLFWSIITAPLMLCAEYRVVPFLWMAAFLCGLGLTIINAMGFSVMGNQLYLSLALGFPFLCFVFASLSKKFLGFNGATLAFQEWIFVTGIIAVIFKETIFEGILINFAYSLPVVNYFLILLSIYFIVSAPEWRKGQKILLMCLLTAFVIFYHITQEWSIFRDLINAFFTILILALTAFFMASIKAERMFQWCVTFIGIRFVVLYFQALGGLATTGVGLIISGIIIIALCILWNKYRKHLTLWAERWIA